MCQLQHKQLPPHIEFIQLKPKNCLQQIHYLVELEDVLPTQKNVSHPTVVVCGDDQITLCIQDKGNTNHFTLFSKTIFLFNGLLNYANILTM